MFRFSDGRRGLLPVMVDALLIHQILETTPAILGISINAIGASSERRSTPYASR